MKTEYKFALDDLEKSLKDFSKNKITELTVQDENFAKDKKKILHFLKKVSSDAPDLFVSFKIFPECIDSEILDECQNVNCSLEIPLFFFFKKTEKFISIKVNLLNNSGVVFGFDLTFAEKPSDSLKAFKERLDFAVESFSNHIDFPQTESAELFETSRVSSSFSACDIRLARNISFAARTFYSSGRAVSWFNYVLKPLRIRPSAFLQDFFEWQKCNNCDFKSGFVPESAMHQEIEKMQLLFLQLKYEEKGLAHIFSAVNDIVSLNGAFSRLSGENISTVIETEYNPEDLLGPEIMDLKAFSSDVCMEHSVVQVYFNEYGEPDFKILS